MKQTNDAWNRIFSEKGRVFTEPHEDIPDITRSLEERGARTILDLGCGTGRHVVYLARRGFSVFGLDNSPEGIRLSGEWLDEEGLSAELQLQSMTAKLPFDSGFFDAVISVQVIHHAELETIRNVVAEIGRVLKTGGFLFVTVPRMEGDQPETKWGKEYKQVGERTFIPQDGPEKGLVHYFFTPETLRELFGGYDKVDVHLDGVDHYCLSGLKR